MHPRRLFSRRRRRTVRDDKRQSNSASISRWIWLLVRNGFTFSQYDVVFALGGCSASSKSWRVLRRCGETADTNCSKHHFQCYSEKLCINFVHASTCWLWVSVFPLYSFFNMLKKIPDLKHGNINLLILALNRRTKTLKNPLRGNQYNNNAY